MKMLYNRNIFTFLNRGKIYMSKIKKHLQEEFEDWKREQLKQLHSLNAAWRHLILNVLAYLSISIIEYFFS